MAESSTSFKPGQSGNPLGAPMKLNSWGWLLEKFGARMAQEIKQIDSSKLTMKELASLKLIEKAVIEGDLQALNIWMDRVEGRAKQVNENRDVTLEENPMYQQLKSMTSQFREKED